MHYSVLPYYVSKAKGFPMINTIEITTADISDWNSVLEVTIKAYAEYSVSSDKAFWQSYQESIQKTILNDVHSERIVAKMDAKIVGAVLYCPPAEKQMGKALVKNPFPEMRLLAVPPESRNHGIAGLLIDFCEEKARQSGSKVITLHTTVLMQTAKAMYERRGYQRYEAIDFEPVPGFIVWGYKKNFRVVDPTKTTYGGATIEQIARFIFVLN
jgi:ribosomal protein S18 acetylase RimI-like enzyme